MSDTSTNARFIDLGGLQAEMMTHQIQLFYDPSTQEVRAIFNGYPYLLGNDGKYRKVGEDNDILHVELTPLMALCPAPKELIDPVTGHDLSKVSVAGVVLIIKAAYDLFFNQRAAQLAEQEQERAAAKLTGNANDADSLISDGDIIQPA